MENHNDRAKFLMSDARKKWHDPELILKSIGIEKEMTLADLGSGPGFFTIPMAQITGEKGLVYAVDNDSTMLNHLRDNIAKSGVNKDIIKIINSDVCHTGIPKNSVDVAFFANMLHDLENRNAFFQEIKRICKPTALVIDLDWKKVQTEFGPPLRIRLTEEASKRILSENGFTVIKLIDAGPYHYELICKLAVQQ